MKNFIKVRPMYLLNKVAVLIGLSVAVLITSCQGGHIGVIPQNSPASQLTQGVSNTSTLSEIILFCDNPGVGKSSLCNSIFQQNVFKSGASNGGGITQNKQEYIYENKQYIDTPGLADVNLRKQAAAEIEKALKENNNYKIIFVATLESGRIREADLVTINTVCDAIKTDFEYSIIFNKVTNPVIKMVGDNGERLGSYLTTLHKQPSSTLVIKKDGDMEDEKDVYLPSSSSERQKLVDFISGLKSNMILDKNVQHIDVRAYEERVIEMETQVIEISKQLEIQRKETERLRQENERWRQQQLEIERQREAERLRQVELQRQQEAERRQLEIQADQQRVKVQQEAERGKRSCHDYGECHSIDGRVRIYNFTGRDIYMRECKKCGREYCIN